MTDFRLMKNPTNSLLHSAPAVIFATIAAFCLAPDALGKGEPKFSELEKNLKIDRSPLESKSGLVTSYADVIEEARSSVVSIFTTKEIQERGLDEYRDNPLFRYFFDIPEGGGAEEPRGGRPGPKQQGLGSGVIISPDGYILTNNHVIDGADEIKVSLPMQQQSYTAKLVGSDDATDVAILKIPATGLPAATLADSSTSRVGDVVLAIGNPFELEQTVTMGIVSALGRRDFRIVDYANFIQTDAPINQGNSGGALIDAGGRVIGINTAIQGGGGMGMTVGNIGIGFAIPINMSLNIVERLFEGGGKVERGFLGVKLRPMDADWAEALGRPDYSGALVNEVFPETPAAKAGFEYDDLIIEFQGDRVHDADKLRLDIGNTPPGEKVTFKVIRGGKEKEIVATLDSLDKAKLAATGNGETPPGEESVAEEEVIEGVEIADLTPRVRTLLQIDESVSGVVIQNIAPYSPAAENGLESGDIITEVNRVAVNSVAEALAERKRFEGNVIIFRVYSPSRDQSNSVIVRLK